MKRPAVCYADLSKLVSRLKIPVHWHPKKMENLQGPEDRLIKLRQTVTALIKYERIELDYKRAGEVREYSERLISEAIRHGPKCPETMDMADWWLDEKQLVHKLFKVLVPRFQNCPSSFTTLHTAPYWHFSDGFSPELNKEIPDRELNEEIPIHRTVLQKKALLELKGHPYPPIHPSSYSNPRFIQNMLLASAKDFFRKLPTRNLNDAENHNNLEEETTHLNTNEPADPKEADSKS